MRRILPLFLLAAMLLAGCGDSMVTPTNEMPAATGTATEPPATSTVAVAARRPGWISGTVSDAQGKPLSKVTVVIRSGFVGLGNNSLIEVQTDSLGHYARQVNDSAYKVTAYVAAEYKGRHYRLWLHPTDDSAEWSENSSGGVVKDFVWRLAGPKLEAQDAPDSIYSYYGGIISVSDSTGYQAYGGLTDAQQFPDGTKVRIELTPDGALFDGSAGAVIVREVASDKLRWATLHDIPLGDYTARASLIGADGATTALRVASQAAGQNKSEVGDVAAVQFVPSRMGDYGVSEAALYILPE